MNAKVKISNLLGKGTDLETKYYKVAEELHKSIESLKNIVKELNDEK